MWTRRVFQFRITIERVRANNVHAHCVAYSSLSCILSHPRRRSADWSLMDWHVLPSYQHTRVMGYICFTRVLWLLTRQVVYQSETVVFKSLFHLLNLETHRWEGAVVMCIGDMIKDAGLFSAELRSANDYLWTRWWKQTQLGSMGIYFSTFFYMTV